MRNQLVLALPIVLLPTLPVRAIHHDVLELYVHREARVDLEAGGGARVGGVGVVSGLGAV